MINKTASRKSVRGMAIKNLKKEGHVGVERQEVLLNISNLVYFCQTIFVFLPSILHPTALFRGSRLVNLLVYGVFREALFLASLLLGTTEQSFTETSAIYYFMIFRYLEQFGKKLDAEQLDKLVRLPRRVDWLAQACEELRIFGNFRNLNTKIEQLPIGINGLIAMVN